MAMVNFVFSKILDNLVSMQNSLNAKYSIHFAKFLAVLLRKIILVSHKMFFIENKAALPCVTMRERAGQL